MWPKRDVTWHKIETTPEWDVLVVGGGITGAGILREAARASWRTRASPSLASMIGRSVTCARIRT